MGQEVDIVGRFPTLALSHKLWLLITSIGRGTHFLGTSYPQQEKEASPEWCLFGKLLSHVHYILPDMDQD